MVLAYFLVMYANNYCIALNYGPDVYFFPAIFNQATKQDRCLLVEDSCAVYNLLC